MNKKLLFAAAIVAVLLNACKKEVTKPNNPTNEQEDYTTVNMYFTNTATGITTKVKAFYDADGQNVNVAKIEMDTIYLQANTNYTCSIEILDATKNPVDTTTKEIEEKNDEHQFFFETDMVNVTIAKLDKDNNNNAVGLKSSWTVAAASKGHVHVHLTHYDSVEQKKANPNDDTIGETDIEIEVQTVIK